MLVALVGAGDDFSPLVEFAPPAASTASTDTPMTLSPVWPVAVELPLTAVAVPSLVTVVFWVLVRPMELLPPMSDAPLAKLPSMLLVMLVVATTPVAVEMPLAAWALSATVKSPVCVFDALVAPPLAPPAASTVPVWFITPLFPFWPVAVASPLWAEATPVLATVLVLLLMICRLLVLPEPIEAPLAPSPWKELLMLVTADTPVAVDIPLKAPAVLPTLLLAELVLLAEVLPDPAPEPLPPAPPAASTESVLTAAPLLPAWPVALAAPLVEVALPSLATLLVLSNVSVIRELPPAIAPPVARLPV